MDMATDSKAMRLWTLSISSPLRDRQPSFTESENFGKKTVAVFVLGQLL